MAETKLVLVSRNYNNSLVNRSAKRFSLRLCKKYSSALADQGCIGSKRIERQREKERERRHVCMSMCVLVRPPISPGYSYWQVPVTVYPGLPALRSNQAEFEAVLAP